jgi:hypothetical protein
MIPLELFQLGVIIFLAIQWAITRVKLGNALKDVADLEYKYHVVELENATLTGATLLPSNDKRLPR